MTMLSKSSSSYKAHAQYRGLKKFEYICSLVHGGTRKGNNITPTAICYLSIHVPSDCYAAHDSKLLWAVFKYCCYSVLHSRVIEAAGPFILNEFISWLVVFYVF